MHDGQGNVILFTMQRPYQGKTRKEIRDQILLKQATLKSTDIPDPWSPEAMDFINGVSFTLLRS